MALIPPQTPQKPLPGAYIATPAFQRRPSGSSALQASIFRSSAAPSGTSQSSANAPARTDMSYNQGAGPVAHAPGSSQSLSPLARAAKTINTTLDHEARFPALDNYVNQGYSADYDIPTSPAWAPFQKIKMYDIPDRIFEQYNQAQVSTMMGLFADLNHAWITIDNALYLWDYTNPNPDLIGFEEQPNSITAIKLVIPRPGVFVESITRLLVVATTSDIFLIGVAVESLPGGAKSVSLYRTRMQVSIRGLAVSCIEGSAKTGRIFFGVNSSDDVYEITYQQEEKWFQNRCAKINHTRQGLAAVLPALPFTSQPTQDYVKQIAIDDSRNLLYTLSTRSTIKVFHLQPPAGLDLRLSRTLASVMSDTGHKVGQTPLLSRTTIIVSITIIQDKEAQRLNLVATTSTGCRIFFSAISGSYFGGQTSSVLTSMQVHHIKFPPADPSQPPPQSATSPAPNMYGVAQATETQSASLTQTRISSRFPPGYFMCFVQKTPQAGIDMLYMTAPDTGRIARPQEPNPVVKFPEFGHWVTLDSQAQDVGLVTPLFAAAQSPMGFGNELAVQFDQPACEIAVLTNTGVYTYRRRRLVDIFAAAVRYGGGEEGLEGEVRQFVRRYGRGETVATALAVACGQGSEVSTDSRVAKITDPEVLEYARKAFIDYGGKATINENHVIDQGASNLDNIQPSPRHEGMSLYIARLLRSVWKAPMLLEKQTPQGGLVVSPSVPLAKLHEVQRDLTRLQEFLDQNKNFIEGLAGPDALGRVSTKQEETALQAEHRALHSLVTLIADVIEGISFTLVLFDERVEEILLAIPENVRQQLRQMTFEGLFCSSSGKELAKELVKAIVSRNIANGSNVDTVTDALRRRCGGFCSADDCVIFKAQEQLKRASEAGASSESSRALLNESLRLLQRVAASLSMEQLKWAVEQYIAMSFYAGAIQLVLSVAHESDRGNRALSWLNDGSPEQDSRIALYENRMKCYELIHQIIKAVDAAGSQQPETIDGEYTVVARRKREAYDVINGSEDEVFQISLYDWYLAQGWSDRLLDVRSPYVIKYLQRKSHDDLARANLLWRYYAQYDNFLEAANVQLSLAKSDFDLTLEQRIEYLSRAKANAFTKIVGMSDVSRSRQSRQELIREVSDLLDLANIQEDLLQRIRADPRMPQQRRPQIIKHLNSQILSVDDLYNNYADQAAYHDLCLLIYEVADYRSLADIRATWQNLLESTHQQVQAAGEPLPYEAVAEKVRSLGARLNLSESTFPIAILVPMLERYSYEFQRNVAPPTWVVDIFLDLQIPHEAIEAALEGMFYNDEPPFKGRNRKYIAVDMLHVIRHWFNDTVQQGMRPFGSEDNAVAISQTLLMLQTNGLDKAQAEQCAALRVRIDQVLR